ncbi:MAG TPA: BspA family leucine-rich repeat surface protein, partial [Edaphocola sp.]|nr:BspA family leucine-rich repeat surface protein [Edaphocola sp.]
TNSSSMLNNTLLLDSLAFTNYKSSNSYNLTFLNNTVEGAVRLSSSIGNAAHQYIGGNDILGDISVTTLGGGALYEGYGASNQYKGNATFIHNSTGTFYVNNNNNKGFYHKNFKIEGTGNFSINSAQFVGTSNSLFTDNRMAAISTTLDSIRIQKTGGATLAFAKPLSITNMVRFDGGDILTTASSILTFENGSSYEGVSDSSKVLGPVTAKFINTNGKTAVFPVGKLGVYLPVKLSNYSTAGLQEWTAEVIDGDANNYGYNRNTKVASLYEVNDREFFMISKSVSTIPDAYVSLGYHVDSLEISNQSDLKVAHWDGSIWENLGNGATTGNNETGTVQTTALVTNFSPFAVASTTKLNYVDSVYFNYPPTPTYGMVYSIMVGDTLDFDLSATNDKPSQIVTISAPGAPATVTFNNTSGNTANGTFQWIPNSSDIGNHTIKFYAENSTNSSLDSTVVIIDVIARPDSVYFYAPTPTNGTIFSVVAGNNININLVAKDVDSNHSVAISAPGAPATAVLNNISGNPATATFDWTPNVSEVGSYTVKFYAIDNTSTSQDSTYVVINVTSPPPPIVDSVYFITPTPTNGMVYNIIAGNNVYFDLAAKDEDPSHTVTISNYGAPVSATFTNTPGNTATATFNWTPNLSEVGSYTVKFYAIDNTSTSQDSIFVVINVTSPPPPSTGDFETKWLVDNSGEITIPASGSGYNYNLTWTNLTTSVTGYATNLTSSHTITGLTAGEDYKVSISGTYPHFAFTVLSVAKKVQLKEVMHWGNNPWKSMANSFSGAVNMDVTATDVPNLSQVTSMSGMFYGASNLVGVGANWAWNTSNVKNMNSMFYLAQNFNGDISTWNTSNVTSMASMFFNANAFNQDISGWDVSKVKSMKQLFRFAMSFDQNLETWNLNALQTATFMYEFSGVSCKNLGLTLRGWANNINTNNYAVDLGIQGKNLPSDVETDDLPILSSKGWMVDNTGAPAACRPLVIKGFVTKWIPTAGVIKIPASTSYYPYNYAIELKNLSNAMIPVYTETGITGAKTLPVINGDVYQLSITGDYPHFNSSSLTSALKANLIEVTNWGNIQWMSMANSFSGAVNMNVVATDTPDLSQVLSMSGMFYNTSSLTGVGANWTWNTSNVTLMQSLFYNAPLFNQDISLWNTSNVTTMASMFFNAHSFNQNISGWDVSNVTSMNQTFYNAKNFNQDLSNWDVSNLVIGINTFSSPTGTGMDCNNLSNTIACWGSKVVATGGNLGLSNRKYQSGSEVNFINKGWTLSNLNPSNICGTYSGPCYNTGTITAQLNSESNILVYPNPTSGIFYVKAEKGSQYIISDIYGKVIMKGYIESFATQFDLSNHVRGVYIIRVNNQATKVIVK